MERKMLESLSKTWEFSGTYGVPRQIVVAGDRLIGVAGSTIFAVDMHTGKEAVTTDLVPKLSWPHTLSFGSRDPQVTAARGVVYFVENDSKDKQDKLRARRLADGSELPGWKSPVLKSAARLFATGNRLMAVHLDKGITQVSGYDATSGAAAFGPTSLKTQAPGRVAYGDGALFFVAAGKLNAINVDFGDTRWQTAVPGQRLSDAVTPLVAGGVVVVSATGGALYGIDIVTGAVTWSLLASGEKGTNWQTPAVYVPPPAVAATRAANRRAALPTAEVSNPAGAAAAVLAAGIVVATNDVGDVMGVSVQNGKVVWRGSGNKPGAPTIIEETVFVTTAAADGSTQLSRFNLLNGESRGTPYPLPNLATGQSPVIGNGAIHFIDAYGSIVARHFSSQAAAWFNGRDSHIEIKPKKEQFDFGMEDFSIEAWIRSSWGGEIVSGYPTKETGGHGFRLNLAPNGQIRFAVTRSNGGVASYGRTSASAAADGEWHHVALIRRESEFIILLDGISMPVHLPATDQEILDIGGGCALTVGAYVSAENGRASGHFGGLIRELRIWDRALDVATINTNLTVALIGTEPRLRGLWRLDEVQRPGAIVETANVVRRYPATARFVNAASKPTDLLMDGSAYPYLLHESKPQWPYAGTWATRGKNPVSGPAAVSADGIVAFATNSVIYAVGGHDGKRVWSMNVSQAVSAPVADGKGFIMMTEEDSLIRLDSRTGAKTQLAGFDKMPLQSGKGVIPPAVFATYIAAATADGTVAIMKRGETSTKNRKLDGTPVQLVLGDAGLLVLSGVAGARKLNLLNPDTAELRGTIPMQEDPFCTADNWVLCVKDGAVVRIDSANFSFNANAVFATSAKISGKITGLAASEDEDLLVAVTDKGEVHGLTLGRLNTLWQTTLPVGPAKGSNAINPPVFDEDRRVVCTTRSGTIAILDPEHGRLNGLYFANNGAVGRPAIVDGTLFTGCDDTPASDPNVDLDGAMHSVVFGETMALRLNLDAEGRPVQNRTQHAIVEADTKDCTLYLMDVHESCVETWVNIPALTGADASKVGGGILSISPAKKSDSDVYHHSGFDINLWIEPDGTLHYASRAQNDDGTWSGLHVHASTEIIDGKWHHVAVSRMLPPATAPAGSPDRVLLFIDGQAVATTIDRPPAAPTTLVNGMKAFIGAIATDTLTATRPFVGMIGEVRVWDTAMVSTEIVSRMHVKLRGDEPDLLAYWNFDYEAIHDCARQGHDGKMVGENAAAPNWWLTDLPFTQPAYPHVKTAAKITVQGVGRPTTYTMTAKVCRADGSGMPDQEVRLWYMKYTKDDPASIAVNATSLKGVSVSTMPETGGGSSGPDNFFVGRTASDGTIQVTVTTTSQGHGPALDLWTSFMPTNERFHVNVLIDDQMLTKPAPASLTAQAKLIQDYHYTTGNKINHERDRSTWRVVLRAAESNGTTCPREPIAIWADSATTIEVGGKSYPVNQHNPVELTAELNGELTLVIGADDLAAPTLYARAGFMHRNDRIVINADQDVHASLSKMEPEDLTEKRVTNWKRPEDVKPADNKSLLDGDYHEHAPKIAEAVRHVTSSVAQPDSDKPLLKSGPPSPARMKLMELRGVAAGDGDEGDGLLRSRSFSSDALLLGDMKQPHVVPADDQVVLMRTMEGTPREAPVNPEALRESLGGNLGFVLEKKGTGVRYEMLGTQAQVDRERGRATVRAAGPVGALALDKQLLGYFWDDVVDFAVDIYNGATKIVISIVEQVEIAIHKMVEGTLRVIHTVVSSVEDALNAVVGFFEQIAVGIKKLIEFLRVLFDWQEILNTHDVLRDIFLAVFDITSHSLKNTKPFTDALASIAGTPKPTIPVGLENLNTASKGAKDEAPSDGQANSVQGKTLMQRATNTPARSTQYSGAAPPVPSVPESDTPIDVLAKELPALFSDILDLSPADLVARLESIATKLARSGLAAISSLVSGLMNGLADVVHWIARALDAKIDIPFISELYKWITGRDLTLLSVACLAIAVPVNLAYALVTLAQGQARPFAGEAKNIARNMRAAAGLLPRSSTPVPRAAGSAGLLATAVPGTPLAPEIPFVILRSFTALFDLAGDLVFIEDKVKFDDPTDVDVSNFFGLMQGVFGMVAISLQTFECQKNFEARLIPLLRENKEKGWPDKTQDFLPPAEWITYTTYSIQMLLRALRLKGAVSEMLGLGDGPGMFDGIVALKDKHELKITYGIGCAVLGLLPYTIGVVVHNKKTLAARGNDTVTKEFELLAARDILGMIPVLFEWMFTPEGAKTIRRLAPGGAEYIYYGVYGVRHLCGFGGIVLHGVAVFGYGD